MSNYNSTPNPGDVGTRVPRTAPNDTGVVSNPRDMLVDIIYRSAKPPLICVVPKCKHKGLHPQASPVAASFPKRKLPSIQSIRVMSWQCSLSA